MTYLNVITDALHRIAALASRASIEADADWGSDDANETQNAFFDAAEAAGLDVEPFETWKASGRDLVEDAFIALAVRLDCGSASCIVCSYLGFGIATPDPTEMRPADAALWDSMSESERVAFLREVICS